MPELLARLTGVLAGRYEIARPLGSGGMAHVYLAKDRKLDRLVALKVLKPELASVVGAGRFTREIEITGHLQHPHILPLLDAGEADGLPYYIMPYVEGESLADRLRRERQISIPDALRIASEVADALAYAHGQGVVHRDIKPGNIMLAGDDVLVADFGIARALDVSGGGGITSSGVALGTPSYMSPEQAAGIGAVDARSDLYSLACVLYEMLVGEPPFTGPTAQAILARQAVEPVPRISIVRDTVPPALERVIGKGMAKVPADRYATALEFKDALARVRLTESAPTGLRTGRILVGLALAAGVAAVGWLTWKLIPPTGPALDENRVVVFPLVAAGATGGGETVGEDIATVIGHALDGVGPLRWIDGWSLLDDRQRDDPRTLALDAGRAVARSRGAAFFITGRVVASPESTGVYLELHDVAGDSTIARSSGVSVGDPWHAGLRSVNGLLPTLIPGGAPAIGKQWFDRRPAAVASFLLGEGRMRRAQMEAALERYNAALAADSQFTLAAIRGAEAASWQHDGSAARTLITLALAHRADLEPRLAAFTQGYAAYLDGKPDGAVAGLREAIAIDPGMAVAWWALGETYTHLLPRKGPVDSLAEASLSEAHRLDSTAVYVVYHLLETAIRKGERVRAERLARVFEAAEPDSALATHVRIMRTCAFDGAGAVDWAREVRTWSRQVVSAGKWLGAGGSQLACAARAFNAVLAGDTSSDPSGVGRRWGALMGLQHLLVARGQAAEVERLLDSAVQHGMPAAAALYLLDAAVGADLGRRAAEVATRDAERYGVEYRGSPPSNRLWLLALWEASQGRAEKVAAIADELESRADTGGARRDSLLARAVRAHAALARGDSAEALRRFGELVPTAPGDDLVWELAEPLAVERLVLMKLLMASGRMAEALDVGAVFDSPVPLIHLLFVRENLELRLRAARAMAYGDLVRRLSQRLERVKSYGSDR